MDHRKTEKQKKNQILLSILTLILISALGAAVFIAQRQADSEVIPEAGTSWNADHSKEYIVYQDKQYPVIRRLSTLLLIGTDNFAEEEDQLLSGGFRNRALADFLVVLVFDHEKKTVTPFQFNRDTICEVPWLDADGKTGGWKSEHLTYAHSYGSGKEDSCENTVAAVRKLIWNAPVDHYYAFTMDAVPVLNDLVGGVTVKLDEDIPGLGAKYVKGAEITLKGAEALRFIRYREHSGGSNLFRMQRHRQYLSAFLETAKASVAKNQDLVVDAFKMVDPFICTNMTVNSLSEMVDQLCSYEMMDVVTPAGVIKLGEKYYEFHPYEDSLWNCVYTAYCRK